MKFVGEVNQLGEELIRPHDLEILTAPNGSSQEGQIDRIANLGFEARVELTLDDQRRVSVQTTGERVRQLELEEGQIVHVRKDHARTFAPAA
jgi:sulfate transport system ATP-binding protein